MSMYLNRTVWALASVTMGLLAGCGATVPTQTAASAPAPVASPTAGAARTDTICKREVVIGSYFPIRVCKTAEEWERDSRSVERTQDDIARGVGSASPKQ